MAPSQKVHGGETVHVYVVLQFLPTLTTCLIKFASNYTYFASVFAFMIQRVLLAKPDVHESRLALGAGSSGHRATGIIPIGLALNASPSPHPAIHKTDIYRNCLSIHQRRSRSISSVEEKETSMALQRIYTRCA